MAFITNDPVGLSESILASNPKADNEIIKHNYTSHSHYNNHLSSFTYRNQDDLMTFDKFVDLQESILTVIPEAVDEVIDDNLNSDYYQNDIGHFNTASQENNHMDFIDRKPIALPWSILPVKKESGEKHTDSCHEEQNHFTPEYQEAFNKHDHNCQQDLPKNLQLSLDSVQHCPLCLKSYSISEGLAGHLKNSCLSGIIQPPVSFQCPQCERCLPDANSLAAHSLLHEGRRIYECPICDKTFKQSRSLKYHTNIHTGDRPYECTLCSKAFREKGSLRRHKRTHSQERPFKCEFCVQTFKQQIHLRRHTERHLKVKAEPLPDSELNNPGGDIRLNPKPYKCSQCSQTFAQQIEKLEHQRSAHQHSSEAPTKRTKNTTPECPHCGKLFTTSRGLKYHINIHTGARPYLCSVCSKSFRDKASRRRHMRCHAEYQLNHRCLLCESAFATASAWRDHMVRRHSVLDILGTASPPLPPLSDFMSTAAGVDLTMRENSVFASSCNTGEPVSSLGEMNLLPAFDGGSGVDAGPLNCVMHFPSTSNST